MDMNWTIPLRNGTSASLIMAVKIGLKHHHKITIGTKNVDAMYKCLTDAFPDTKVSKGSQFVTVENER